MPERRPSRLSTNLTRVDPPTPVTLRSPKSSGGSGWLVIVGLIVVVFLVSKCGSTSNDSSAPSARVDAAQESLFSAVQNQTPPPMEDLSRTGARTGASRVQIAAVEGLAGELVYSQNCYDALGRAFAWRKLDECGGFDMRASGSLADETATGDEKAAAWFDGEAAAGRYLKAAIAAGLPADEADQRLASLQAAVARRSAPPVEPSAAAPDEEEPSSAPGAEGGDDDEQANVSV